MMKTTTQVRLELTHLYDRLVELRHTQPRTGKSLEMYRTEGRIGALEWLLGEERIRQGRELPEQVLAQRPQQ